MMVVTVTDSSTQEAMPVKWFLSPDEDLEWVVWSEQMLAMIERQGIELPMPSDGIDIAAFARSL